MARQGICFGSAGDTLSPLRSSKTAEVDRHVKPSSLSGAESCGVVETDQANMLYGIWFAKAE